MSPASRSPGPVTAAKRGSQCLHKSQCLRALRLPEPLTGVLKSPVDSGNFAHSWRRIEAQLDGVQPPLPVVMRSRSRIRRIGATSVAASTALALLMWALDWDATPTQVISVGEQVGPVALVARASEPIAQEPLGEPTNDALHLVGGAQFTGVDATAGSVGVTFEDGSTLLVRKHGAVEPLVMNEQDVILRLKGGTVDVSVVPGGSHRWIVQAGAVSVEVVGTQFTVNRTDERVTVRVSRGSVLVRSEQLPERIERLGADEELTVDTSSETASPVRARRLTPPTTESPKVQARRVSTLLEQADQARLRADWSTARRALERVVKDFAADPRASVAAYQLALVRQKQGASPVALTHVFSRALEMASGASLRQDCYWSLLQAQIAAGQSEAAARTARSALDEFPLGRYSERLREHLVAGEDE